MLALVNKETVKYSQSCIRPYYSSDPLSLVANWINADPYTSPIEVMKIDAEPGSYISLDNRRLYSARRHGNLETVSCIVVYNSSDHVTVIMQDHGLDICTLLLKNDDPHTLHRLVIRATNIEAVTIIRCASQNSTFHLTGNDDLPAPESIRIYDPMSCKINPPDANFMDSGVDFFDNLRDAGEIYIRAGTGDINVYHQREDLRRLIIDRPDLFNLVRYERCTVDFNLKARGEVTEDGNDDDEDTWNQLFAFSSEVEDDREDQYYFDLFKSLEIR